MTIAKSPDDNAASVDARGRPLGVYVHFPWCVSKCPYCDFFSVATQNAIPNEQYANAVIAEFDARSAELDSSTIRSLYFGGGTPSLWDPESLARVVSHVVQAAGVEPSEIEITLECNPSSFEMARCAQWRAAGINRLSLGLQSLNPEHLKFLGRAHNDREGMLALEQALQSGIANIGTDFIFGLPAQLPKDAVAQLSRLPLSELSHLSVYALTIESNTPFGALARAGRLPLAQDDDVVSSFFELHEFLESSGFEHYEISNYARPSKRAVHNSGYWTGDDYLGLGVSAWGTVHRKGERSEHSRLRYRNTTRIAYYLENATSVGALWSLQPEGILSDREPIDDSTAFSERIMLGLRTKDGLDLARLPSNFEANAWLARRHSDIDKLCAQKRLVRDGSVLRVPLEAWFVADGTIASLI